MIHLHIFTDGSVHPQSKVGYGAYLVVSDLDAPMDSLSDTIRTKRFEQTTSTTLELQTLLWTLRETISFPIKTDIALSIYTDSQNIISLPKRRSRLEQTDYISSKNKRLGNHELYKEFYRVTSEIKYQLFKVVGHQASNKKNKVDRLFGLVDRASRKALRKYC